jgi:hypothetical protein
LWILLFEVSLQSTMVASPDIRSHAGVDLSKSHHEVIFSFFSKVPIIVHRSSRLYQMVKSFVTLSHQLLKFSMNVWADRVRNLSLRRTSPTWDLESTVVCFVMASLRHCKKVVGYSSGPCWTAVT